MQLVRVAVGPFRSIDTEQTVEIDSDVTVLVGMNEAGKTVFLRALEKSRDALELARFDPVEDYPRKDLSSYLKAHKAKPARAVKLTFRLSDEETSEVNKKVGTLLQPGFEFSTEHRYDNSWTVSVNINEAPALAAIVAAAPVNADVKAALKSVKTMKGIPDALKGVSLTDNDKAWLASIEKRISSSSDKWESVLGFEFWAWAKPQLPKFAFFGEYEMLPSKVNLADLANRVQQVKAWRAANPAEPQSSAPKHLEPDHRGVLALLRMADIAIEDFTASGGYEPLKARLEAVSISLTDQIMQFWKQNEELEVEIDIKQDSEDVAPFNNGPNLYLRIKNRRHRGVSTPFHQRSRGFTWFFSFLVWFDEIQHQLGGIPGDAKETPVILLLDEPGLSLHALAQADFLAYIDNLTEKHQVLYTTHSPFMVHSDRLHQVRVVEDRRKEGTVITSDVSGSDPRTIFPLQAALGWTIAQNLFVSARNLLVEGPADLVYLQAISSILEAQKLTALRDDVTIVPTGGLDKVVTFVALLGANSLKLAVLHDYRGRPEQKLADLVRQKLITPSALLDASQFRDLTQLGVSGRPTDLEDLLPPALYLQYFNAAFVKKLGGKAFSEAQLPPGDRIIDRIDRHVGAQGIVLRADGGFNHYAVAQEFGAHPPAALDADTISRFEALFRAVNALF